MFGNNETPPGGFRRVCFNIAISERKAMGKRIILAGVLGGVGMFVWSSIAHMALPLGEAGIQEISNEQALLGPTRHLGGEAGHVFVSGDEQGCQSKAGYAGI